MWQTLRNWLVDPSGLTPHGFCLLWEPGLIWTYALSDAGIALAYFTIPVALAVLAWRRGDMMFRPIFWLFAAFILLCGTTHVLDVVTLWVPAYGLEAVVKVMTAAVSMVTAVIVWRLLPHALSMPSARQLEEANVALKASESRHRASFERSPVPLYTVDGDDVIVNVSDSWLSLLGYRKADVVGRPIDAFRTADSEVLDARKRSQLMRDGAIFDMRRRFVRQDGGIVEALVSARLDGDDGDSIICVLIDITDRLRTESALRASEECLHQAQKMEAVGQLSGGMAHDINNMLQGISGCLELIDSALVRGKTQDIRRYVIGARQSVDRAANLTHRVLAFARRQSLMPRVIQPAEMITNMVELIHRTVGPSVVVRAAMPEGAEGETWLALCDNSQLESALLNLAINARDAMPDGGVLTIGAVNRHMTATDLQDQPDVAEGDYIEISVTDTGTGMTPDVLRRVFEPFFTTKPVGEGTGLGLSQVYGFVTQSGGFVRLDSALGMGTTVQLFLPRNAIPEPSENMPAAGVADAKPPAAIDNVIRGRTVLVVDDEAEVRSSIVSVLRDMGLQCLEATTGTEGLQILESAAPIDVLITDIGLPGLNGRQLSEAADRLRPGLPVLLITGYAWTAADAAIFTPDTEILRKPFALDDLCGRVCHMLRAAGVDGRLPA